MKGIISQNFKRIIVCNDDPTAILRTPTLPLIQENWNMAKETAAELYRVREHILGGGAGLAAPQIGISQPIFIYTPDRTTANLRVVINPSYEAVGTSTVYGEEACFSVPLHATRITRWEKIKVNYQNLEGESVEEVLDGFAAKVFQHEMDHLNGKLTIDHPSAKILSFPNVEAFEEHMSQVRVEDAVRYR